MHSHTNMKHSGVCQEFPCCQGWSGCQVQDRQEMSPGVRVAPDLGKSRVPRKGGDLYPAGEREPLQTSKP